MPRIVVVFCLLLISTSSLALQAGRYELKSIHQIETAKQDYIDYDLTYPAFNAQTTNPLEKNFNTAITDIIDTEKSTFLSDVYSVERDKLPPDLASLNNTMKITYEVMLLTSQPEPLLSLLFTVDTYVVGAAHPNSTHRTFTFNFKTGEAIAIAELFKKNSNFVAPLNHYIAKKLQPRMNKSENDMVKDNEINYAQWNLTQDGLLVTMDEFPHVYGLVQVLVPYTVIKDKLNLNGPLSICMSGNEPLRCH